MLQKVVLAPHSERFGTADMCLVLVCGQLVESMIECSPSIKDTLFEKGKCVKQRLVKIVYFTAVVSTILTIYLP